MSLWCGWVDVHRSKRQRRVASERYWADVSDAEVVFYSAQQPAPEAAAEHGGGGGGGGASAPPYAQHAGPGGPGGAGNLSMESYADILEGIDDLNFASQAPPGAEDYLPTESSDIDMGRMTVGERLYYIGCGMERNKQERLRKEREHRVVSELSQVTAKPMITQRARELPSKGVAFPEQSLAWQKRLDKERRKQSARQCMDEVAETLQTVQMSARSQALLERGRLKATYRGPIAGWNKHFARYQTKKNVVPDREIFAPNINASSATLERDGTVGDRLHEEAYRKVERLRTMMHHQSQEELVDPETRLPYFQPRVVRSRSRDVDAVVSTLLSKGQEAQKKREKQASDDARHSFTPVINQRSSEIVGVKGRRPLYDPAKFKKNSKRDRSCDKDAGGAGAEEGGAGGGGAGGSRREAASPHFSTCTQSFVRRNERLLLNRQERAKAIRRQQDAKELEQCTFTPRICKQSEDILQGGTAYVERGATATRSKSADHTHGHAHAAASQHQMSLTGMRASHGGAGAPPLREGVPAPQYDLLPTTSPAHGARGAPDALHIDPHVTSFEKEMLNVLEEWRRLEEV
eukprot:Rhum_TRINITY_DN14382_c18_g1::Rhum_TRINITY_DN14382_c18_g1_i1::g.85377::m.85377